MPHANSATTHTVGRGSALAVAYHLAFHGHAINPDTGTIAEYKELSQCSNAAAWQQANAEEIGRLAQGLGKDSTIPHGTDTLFFIHCNQMPKDRKATYIRVICANQPEKPNPRRVRWMVGGDRVDYPGNVTTQTADMTTAKCLFNSVLSTPNAKCFNGDLKDFPVGYPNGSIQVRAHTSTSHPTTRHGSVSTARLGMQRLRICQDTQRHVRTTTSWYHCQ